MAKKVWLQERWEMLLPLLEELTVDQEEEIAQICVEEIEAWRARPTMKKVSSLKEPMTATRNAIRELPLTERNTWLNTRTKEREHIALKHMNYSEEEWAEMGAPSEEKFQERQEDRKFIDHPDAVVQKARELLRSKKWEEIAVGLAVTTGRRLSEVLKVGKFTPKTDYTVEFEGQLKRKDKELKPYEIPTLVEADLVLGAWKRLREAVDCSKMEKEKISIKYGPAVVDAAQRHFEALVPAREGGNLYTHLFRSIYGRIASYYYAPRRVSDLTYMAEIYGHYWVVKATGQKLRNYGSTMHYMDYLIGDGQDNIDGRQGIKLGESGVEVLKVFQREGSSEESPIEEGSSEVSPVEASSVEQEGAAADGLMLEEKKGHSITRMEQGTKSRIDRVQKEEHLGKQDDALALVLDEHYVLKQMIKALSPLYEQLEVDNPVGAVHALLGNGRAVMVDQHLGERWQTSLAEVEELLENASEHAQSDKPYQAEYERARGVVHESANDGSKPVLPLQEFLREMLKAKGPKYKSPMLYLRGLLSAKGNFLKSYEKRHVGKDYSQMSTSELRNTKMPGAAQERYRRAVSAIMEYNDAAKEPEMRWYISAAVVVDLIGGRPSDAKEYLEGVLHEEIAAHHKKYALKPGYNRRPVPITQRVTVREAPTVVESTVVEEEGVESTLEEVRSEETVVVESNS